MIFSLTDISTSSIVSSMPKILSSVSYILLVMLLSVVPFLFPRFSISMVAVCVFFIDSIWQSKIAGKGFLKVG